MARKTPKYAEYGLKKVAPGKYIDQAGNNVSERQMRKIIGTPAKGSQGVKEYRTERYGTTQPTSKPKGPSYKERLADFLRKTPGGTEEWFKTGKQPEIPYYENQTAERHNKQIDKQRREAIRAQRKAGLISETEYNSMMGTLRLQQSYRSKILHIEDKIKFAKDMKTEEIDKLKSEQQIYLNQYRKLDRKMNDYGLVPNIDEFKYGWYGGERSPGTRRHHRPRKKAS